MKKLSVVWLLFFCTAPIFSQERNWFSLPEELSGGLVFDLVEYHGELIACGTFTMASGQPVNSIAAWDGTNWSGLGSGLTLSVGSATPRKMIVHNDSLFVIGNFDTAGGISSFDVAGWDGDHWFSLGNSNDIFTWSIEVFNDELYILGNFDSIGGVEAKGIATWNSGVWQNVAEGVRNDSGYGVGNGSCVYDNKLFVSGGLDSAGTIACDHIAWWDGTTWGTIPGNFPPWEVSMITWQDTLFFGFGGSDMGTNYMNEIHFWDGATFNWYTWQAMSGFGPMIVFNGELYGAGGDGGYNYGSTVWKRAGPWEINGAWEMVGSGLSNWVYTLCEYNGDLYAGGSFKKSSGSEHNYIARYALMNGIEENNAVQKLQIYPNPFSENVTLHFELEQKENVVIGVVDFQGRLIHEIASQSFETGLQKINLDLSDLQSGIYFLSFSVGDQISYRKIVKQ